MLTKILIVDDELELQRLIQKRFKQKIASKDYNIVFANNGEEALDQLRNDPSIGIILTDINMPVMDGLTLLGKITGLGRVFKAVVVSAYGDMKNIRIAMNRGASDFVTKPVDFNDLEKTIDKMVEEYESELRFKSIQKELDIARLIQEDMLPKDFTPLPKEMAEISGKMIPAREVGGDFYDFLDLGNNKLGIFISDVSGKGIPACLYMTVTKVLFRMLANKNLECNEIMTQLNALLSTYIPYMFVTAFTGVIDFEKKTFKYSNAGHCLPYVLHSDGSVEELKSDSGVPLGVAEIGSALDKFEQNEISLSEGDCLFFFTDGVTEAMNGNQEMFDDARLFETLKNTQNTNTETIIDNVIKEIKSFVGSTDQHDDITMLVVRYHDHITSPSSKEPELINK